MKEKNTTVVSRDSPSRGRTDWKKFHNLTDAEIGLTAPATRG